MDITTRHIGFGKNSSIELTITDYYGKSSIAEDVTNLHGKVDEDFILSLRNIADELEEQNTKISEQ